MGLIKEIYAVYKPLRNQLTKISMLESLGVIRAYEQHLQFNKTFPDDIEVSSEFLSAKHWVEKKIYLWDLETLAREIIIHSPDKDPRILPKTLRRWLNLARVVNKLRVLDGVVSQQYPEGGVLRELYRSVHRQIFWQMKPNKIGLGRYFKIFNHPKINLIILRVIGITTKQLYTLGLALTGHYSEYFILEYPPQIDIKDLDQDVFDNFIKHFSKDISSLRNEVLKVQTWDEKYLYTFNPLRAYPLIRMNVHGKDSLVCPLPTLLFRRFTEGVYYEICNEPDFAMPFGESFQDYIGEVIKHGIKGSNMTAYTEKQYYNGKDRKDTVDWIVGDTLAALFIECKTKRLRLGAKSDVKSLEILAEELDKMADFIVQLYKTIRDYRNNLYPEYPFDPKKQIFPLVLTLEDWFPMGDRIFSDAGFSLNDKFSKAGLDQSWLTEMPYSICSVEDFERIVQIIPQTGLKDFMRGKIDDPETRSWSFYPYIIKEFPEELKKTRILFPEILDKLIEN